MGNFFICSSSNSQVAEAVSKKPASPMEPEISQSNQQNALANKAKGTQGAATLDVPPTPVQQPLPAASICFVFEFVFF